LLRNPRVKELVVFNGDIYIYIYIYIYIWQYVKHNGMDSIKIFFEYVRTHWLLKTPLLHGLCYLIFVWFVMEQFNSVLLIQMSLYTA